MHIIRGPVETSVGSAESETVTIEREKDGGRAVILLYSGAEYGSLAEDCFRGIKESRALILRLPRVSGGNWRCMPSALEKVCAEKSIRNFHSIAFGDASVAAIQFVLCRSEALRSLVLVDGIVRNDVSGRLGEFVERCLPLLRASDSNSFDFRSFLQRIHCPVLVALTDRAGRGARRDSGELSSKLPTSSMFCAGSSPALVDAVNEFLTVPPKFPQRKRTHGGL